MKPVTVHQARWLRALAKLDEERRPMRLRQLAVELGNQTASATFQMMRKLESLGLITKGKRLVYEDGPVLTPAAKKQLGLAA